MHRVSTLLVAVVVLVFCIVSTTAACPPHSTQRHTSFGDYCVCNTGATCFPTGPTFCRLVDNHIGFPVNSTGICVREGPLAQTVAGVWTMQGVTGSTCPLFSSAVMLQYGSGVLIKSATTTATPYYATVVESPGGVHSTYLEFHNRVGFGSLNCSATFNSVTSMSGNCYDPQQHSYCSFSYSCTGGSCSSVGVSPFAPPPVLGSVFTSPTTCAGTASSYSMAQLSHEVVFLSNSASTTLLALLDNTGMMTLVTLSGQFQCYGVYDPAANTITLTCPATSCTQVLSGQLNGVPPTVSGRYEDTGSCATGNGWISQYGASFFYDAVTGSSPVAVLGALGASGSLQLFYNQQVCSGTLSNGVISASCGSCTISLSCVDGPCRRPFELTTGFIPTRLSGTYEIGHGFFGPNPGRMNTCGSQLPSTFRVHQFDGAFATILPLVPGANYPVSNGLVDEFGQLRWSTVSVLPSCGARLFDGMLTGSCYNATGTCHFSYRCVNGDCMPNLPPVPPTCPPNSQLLETAEGPFCVCNLGTTCFPTGPGFCSYMAGGQLGFPINRVKFGQCIVPTPSRHAISGLWANDPSSNCPMPTQTMFMQYADSIIMQPVSGIRPPTRPGETNQIHATVDGFGGVRFRIYVGGGFGGSNMDCHAGIRDGHMFGSCLNTRMETTACTFSQTCVAGACMHHGGGFGGFAPPIVSGAWTTPNVCGSTFASTLDVFQVDHSVTLFQPPASANNVVGVLEGVVDNHGGIVMLSFATGVVQVCTGYVRENTMTLSCPQSKCPTATYTRAPSNTPLPVLSGSYQPATTSGPSCAVSNGYVMQFNSSFFFYGTHSGHRERGPIMGLAVLSSNAGAFQMFLPDPFFAINSHYCSGTYSNGALTGSCRGAFNVSMPTCNFAVQCSGGACRNPPTGHHFFGPLNVDGGYGMTSTTCTMGGHSFVPSRITVLQRGNYVEMISMAFGFEPGTTGYVDQFGQVLLPRLGCSGRLENGQLQGSCIRADNTACDFAYGCQGGACTPTSDSLPTIGTAVGGGIVGGLIVGVVAAVIIAFCCRRCAGNRRGGDSTMTAPLKL